jgi:Tfp pilus assembly protein PilF
VHTSIRSSSGRRRAGASLLLALACTAVLGACSSSKDAVGKQAGPSAAPTASEDTSPAGLAVKAGLAKHVAGDLDGAAADYTRALQTDGKNVLALYNLGLVAQTKGDRAGAEQKYRAVLQTAPDYQPAVFNLAILREQAGSDAEAEQLYRQAIGLRPGDAGAHLNIGLLLRQTGKQVEGDAEVATALALNPEFVDPATR